MIEVTQALAMPNGAAWDAEFAIILLQFGGTVLVAALFSVAGRASHWRGYFGTWTIACYSLAVAMAAVTARHWLMARASGGSIPADAALVGALDWICAIGKNGYWIMVWRGAVEYSTRTADSRWRWLAAAFAIGSVGFLVAGDMNMLMLFQAPVAIACCGASAVVLIQRGRRPRRAEGGVIAAAILAATGALWVVYFAAFANTTGLVAGALGRFASPILPYSQYADILVSGLLACALLIILMEDARERIVSAELRLASLVTSAPDPILTIDAGQKVVDANAAASQAFGGARPGADIATFVAPADRERLRAAISRFSEGEELFQIVGDNERLSAVHADGSSFAAEFTISRLHDADLATVSVLVRNVTGRFEREERRRQTSTMEAVRQLAGGLAHDFNNLLTTIAGRSQIVARTLPSSSPVREDVQQIERAAAAAARLSQGLLALSRREPLDPERLSVDQVVDHCRRSMVSSSDSGIIVTLRLGSSDARAHVDRRRLEGALNAIIQNAVDAAGGAGTITIETSRSLLPHHAGATSEAVGVSVRDNGPGLTADARAHLFEPFFSTKGDGRGLGLATTWAFVHQSGGTLDVDSGPRGTTVRMSFPVAAEQPGDGVRTSRPALAMVEDSRRTRRNVLLAEDEPSVRKSVGMFLERSGFTVVEAADGVEALAAFERTPDDFGLLLTDVMMPQMGGRELTTRLLGIRPNLRVVFMSGFLRDPEVLRMVNDRRVRFISKPFDVDALIAIVAAELDQEGASVA